MPGGKMKYTHQSKCSADFAQTHTQTHTELTADYAFLPWKAQCQVDVRPLHAAQALLLDGAPVAEVGAMNGLSGAVRRTSQDRFQLQIHYLIPAVCHHSKKEKKGFLLTSLSDIIQKITNLPKGTSE